MHMLECNNMPEHRKAAPSATRQVPRQRAAGGPVGGPPPLRLVALLFLAGCAMASVPIPTAWETATAANFVGAQSDYCLYFDCVINPRPANIRVWGNQLFNGSKALTPVFAAINSFDVSFERKEVVFSAK